MEQNKPTNYSELRDEIHTLRVNDGEKPFDDLFPGELTERNRVMTFWNFLKLSLLDVLAFVAPIILTLATGLRGVAISYSKNEKGKYPYIISTMNVVIQMCILLAVLLMYAVQRWVLRQTKTPLWIGWRKTLHLAVPSLLYSINNYVTFSILLYLSPAEMGMWGQIKIVFTALISTFIGMETYDMPQWISILYLSLGAVLTQMRCGEDSKGTFHFNYGILLSLLSSFLSSLGGVYTKKRLSGDMEDSLNIQNAHMAFYNGIFSCFFLIYDQELIREIGFFGGYSYTIVYVIVTNVLISIMISYVLKYFGIIVRVFTQIGGLLLAVIFTYLLLNHDRTIITSFTFIFGSIIVLLTVPLYNHRPLSAELLKWFTGVSNAIKNSRFANFVDQVSPSRLLPFTNDKRVYEMDEETITEIKRRTRNGRRRSSSMLREDDEEETEKSRAWSDTITKVQANRIARRLSMISSRNGDPEYAGNSCTVSHREYMTDYPCILLDDLFFASVYGAEDTEGEKDHEKTTRTGEDYAL